MKNRSRNRTVWTALKGHSHGVIATEISLLQLMGCRDATAIRIYRNW